MDFAPYQDSAPEVERTLSPPPNGNGRRSASFSPPHSPVPYSGPGSRNTSNPNANPQSGAGGPWPPTNAENLTGFGNDVERNGAGGLSVGGGAGGHVYEFDTSLPLRLDYEACLAYLLLPPAGGVLLLVLEHKSDYVRFHAWQSSLVFSAVFLLHLFLSWSAVLSWIMFVGDLGLIGFLTFRAYTDADTLDRFEVPFFGPLASRFVDDE